MNVVNYAQKYMAGLDQKIQQQLMSAGLETPSVNWLDAKTFVVSTVATSGFKSHTRNKGFNEGSVSNTRENYTLAFDRDVEFFIDRMDVDESNQDLATGNITNVFLTEHAVPEIDAYRFSKLATLAIAEPNQFKEETITKENVYSRLKEAILPIRKYGPTNMIVYVSSEVMDALERSTEFTRSITVQNLNGPSSLESRITSIDGVQIVEIWDANRFHTKFDFTDGFKPATGAKAINFLVVAKQGVVSKAKLNSVFLFAPGQHTEGDGYLYQNRLYHDLFVLKNKKDGVFVSHKAAPVGG